MFNKPYALSLMLLFRHNKILQHLAEPIELKFYQKNRSKIAVVAEPIELKF